MVKRGYAVAWKAFLMGCVGAGAPAMTCAQEFRALVFTKTAGFRHDSIAAAIAAVQQLGDANCFAVEATEDAAIFNSSDLERFTVVMFLLTTGDVLNEPQQVAFEQWLTTGRGWVGVHSAADTEYSWPFYGAMIGGYFAGHPAPQQATIHVEDAGHPSTDFLPAQWVRFDEWYDYLPNPWPVVQVLLRLDESTYSGGQMGADHPIAWYQVYEGGRVWYTGGGHTIESYSEVLFRRHILGGILWAAHRDGVHPYANCDQSTQPPILNIADFSCFLQKFAAGDPYANCDGSTQPPVLNVADFGCFLQAFAAGCR
jgi:cytochrome c